MTKTIQEFAKGDLITARRLNEYSSSINTINKDMALGPRTVEDDVPPEAQKEAAEDPDTVTLTANNYIESSRETSQVQVFDQNETNYALVDRIDSITFSNDVGDTITLTFDNS